VYIEVCRGTISAKTWNRPLVLLSIARTLARQKCIRCRDLSYQSPGKEMTRASQSKKNGARIHWNKLAGAPMRTCRSSLACWHVARRLATLSLVHFFIFCWLWEKSGRRIVAQIREADLGRARWLLMRRSVAPVLGRDADVCASCLCLWSLGIFGNNTNHGVF
jgi:hypothetical protein